MLKALELIGFKSFADRTRFEFPRGITVVVGPNGSGKSNIVDAIKWVLGEQSVKSLRGTEMADVIFNGSGARRPLNSAEITLTFDNSAAVLPIDAPDVHITRRVYRSGEGEYLINRQPCRLRDIRDLFSGTGVATEAYSVIEQGKVDVLLQASARDRRVIFEEAAGISRFKAKKIETLRRLERVEQNLLRLSDIVDEVDNRLRSVRTQAAKARRYQEHADRLQELRTQVARVDWQQLTERLHQFDGELTALRDEIAASQAQSEAIDAQGMQLEITAGDLDHQARDVDSRIARHREQIAAHESTIEHQRARSRDLNEEIERSRRQLASMTVRAGDVQEQARALVAMLGEVETQNQATRNRLTAAEKSADELNTRCAQLHEQQQRLRQAHLECMRTGAALASEVKSLTAAVEQSTATGQRAQRRRGAVEDARKALRVELDGLRQQQAESTTAAETKGGELRQAQERLAERRRQQTQRQRELSQLRGRHSGMTERASVLDELEQRHEGVSLGVKEVLRQVRQAEQGPLTQIRGLLADLLHVNVETAPLVEVALGELAQHLVVAPGQELFDFLEQDAYRFAGRVGFVPLVAVSNDSASVNLQGRAGVLGRADQFVETAPEFVPLIRRLLGRTWIVEKLAHARALAKQSAGRGLSFVTLASELLAADGTLSVGPRHVSVGLISRRSELRALRRQIAEIEALIATEESAAAALERQIAADDEQGQMLAAQYRQAVDQLAEHRLRTRAAEQRLNQLDEQCGQIDAELREAESQMATASTRLAQSRARLEAVESETAVAETRIGKTAEDLARFEDQRQRHERDAAEARVELAASEQRLKYLEQQARQSDEDRQERDRAIVDLGAQLAQCDERVRQSERAILQSESAVAALYLQKESFAGETLQLVERRESIRQQRSELAQESQKLRAKMRRLEEKGHAKELAAGEIRHERATLEDRLREDYGIELAQLQLEQSAEEVAQRHEIEQEIAELRRKIANIGGVNLEALNELAEIEARHASLSGQYQDLVSAKTSLQQIIDKINADSRRLFAETLETVRGHFQTLFRKLFGGGRADIVLEEGIDILDSGIEIVARPPGKEPRSISLLSGGEKTLTCVALLLAIFRSRPSPFCVLDEVDAALDEANIERFIEVLKEFLAWTQFIVVTHSKKTMTCAGTLYGVTMQESGVSKRVSVRFDDVSENGEINTLRDAAGNEPPQAADDETQAA